MRKLPYEDDYWAIKAWLELPRESRPALPPKQEELWKRWNYADDMLREHYVESKVIDRLCEKFGYSKTSAERDIRFAKRYWGFVPPEEKEYMRKMLMDFGTATMVSARKDKDYGAVARLMKELRELAGIGKTDQGPVDPKDLLRPVTLIAMFSPELIGGTVIPEDERKALFERMMVDKRDKGFIESSTLAKFVEENPERPEDGDAAN